MERQEFINELDRIQTNEALTPMTKVDGLIDLLRASVASGNVQGVRGVRFTDYKATINDEDEPSDYGVEGVRPEKAVETLVRWLAEHSGSVGVGLSLSLFRSPGESKSDRWKIDLTDAFNDPAFAAVAAQWANGIGPDGTPAPAYQPGNVTFVIDTTGSGDFRPVATFTPMQIFQMFLGMVQTLVISERPEPSDETEYIGDLRPVPIIDVDDFPSIIEEYFATLDREAADDDTIDQSIKPDDEEPR